MIGRQAKQPRIASTKELNQETIVPQHPFGAAGAAPVAAGVIVVGVAPTPPGVGAVAGAVVGTVPAGGAVKVVGIGNAI
jgi:hypothetical protein